MGIGYLFFSAVALGLLCLVYFIGIMVGAAKERAKKPAPIQPICPCSHFASMHADGKECLAELSRKLYDWTGDFAGYEYVKCPCTVYQGPKVINDDFFHPGIITP